MDVLSADSPDGMSADIGKVHVWAAGIMLSKMEDGGPSCVLVLAHVLSENKVPEVLVGEKLCYPRGVLPQTVHNCRRQFVSREMKNLNSWICL